VPCRRRNAHTPHGNCLGTAPEFPGEPVEQVSPPTAPGRAVEKK
jgi:hypothetical protein